MLKATFPLSYFSVTKSTKSHIRGLSSLLYISFRVHELVARAVRGKCVRHGAKHKSAVLPITVISTIPRVRTYRTREPSRFVHALSARPLKKRGAGVDKVSALTEQSDKHYRHLIRQPMAATFLAVARSRSGSDSPQGCHSFPSRRFATHWRRLIKPICTDRLHYFAM